MKTLNEKTNIDNFVEFALTTDEMLKVKGGEDPGEATPPIIPPKL